MNFIISMDYYLNMRTLYVLAVVAGAVVASPSCSLYCDMLYHGWKVAIRSDCNCVARQQKLQNGSKYEQDLKTISQNHEVIFKGLHKNQENHRISLTNINLTGFVNKKPSEVKYKKIKRASHDEIIPVKIVKNSPIISKLFNNTQISDKNLSDCKDFLMFISIRKRNNKSIAKLKKNAIKKCGNSDNSELNIEMKNKRDQVTAKIQESIEKIKKHQNNISKKKKQDVNVTPKIDVRSEVTNETAPADTNNLTYTKENVITTSTVKSTTPYEDTYSNTITTINNTTLLDSALNDFNLSSTLDDSTNTQPTTRNKSYLPYKFSALLIEGAGVQNKSMLMADYSRNVKERTSETNQFITDSNKTLVTKIINLNNTSLKNSYNENEVPITRIITREYPNNTISSFVNATEVLSYFEFEENS